MMLERTVNKLHRRLWLERYYIGPVALTLFGGSGRFVVVSCCHSMVSPKAPPILFKERRFESLCPATLSQVGLAGVGQFRGALGLYWIVGAQSVGFVRADLIRER